MSFLSLSDKIQNYQVCILLYAWGRNNIVINDGSALGNPMYFQSPNPKNKGFMQFSKLCWNLCSLRWLKRKRRQFSSVNPFGSKILNILFCTGRISNSNLLLKTEINSEFLILSYHLNWTNLLRKKEKFDHILELN